MSNLRTRRAQLIIACHIPLKYTTEKYSYFFTWGVQQKKCGCSNQAKQLTNIRATWCTSTCTASPLTLGMAATSVCNAVTTFVPSSFGQNVCKSLAMRCNWFFTSHTTCDKWELKVNGKKEKLQEITILHQSVNLMLCSRLWFLFDIPT